MHEFLKNRKIILQDKKITKQLMHKFKKTRKIISQDKNYSILVKPFPANSTTMEKPVSWFLLAKCVKNTRGRVTF